MNESESVDFIRAAVISFVAAESDQACAFPTLSNAIIRYMSDLMQKSSSDVVDFVRAARFSFCLLDGPGLKF